MKISGFSFVRNGIRFDYPFRESLQSLLALCDEVVVAVGRSDDATLATVQSLASDKLRIIETVWDDSLRRGGRILAQQTNEALKHCTGDWCIYLQADELLHENDYERLRAELARADSDTEVEALLMRYRHFYGSYDYLGTGRQWYRQEIRAVRNTGRVISWGDAQGFRKRLPDGGSSPLQARRTPVYIYHYGWVKAPAVQQDKLRNFHRLWHDDNWLEHNLATTEAFDYDSSYELAKFADSHPALMHARIEGAREWTRFFDPTRLRRKPFLMKVTDAIEKLTGYRIGEYKNFREVP